MEGWIPAPGPDPMHDNTSPPPKKVNPFVPPPMYSPRQAVDQKTTFNPMSTSLNYLARFGTAKHF